MNCFDPCEYIYLYMHQKADFMQVYTCINSACTDEKDLFLNQNKKKTRKYCSEQKVLSLSRTKTNCINLIVLQAGKSAELCMDKLSQLSQFRMKFLHCVKNYTCNGWCFGQNRAVGCCFIMYAYFLLIHDASRAEH